MRWKQFFKPVNSFKADQAQTYLEQQMPDAVNLLDVRQPGEYEAGHLPGAKLIPLTELADRLEELDPNKPTVVY